MPALLLFVLAATAVSPPAGSTSGGLPPRIRAVAKATPASFGGLVARRPVLARVPRPLQARHAQLYLLFGSRMVQSSMRLAMGPLIVYICEEMGGGAGSRGKLLSAYSLGYLTSQIAGGALADRIGPKRVILWASVLGGLCTMASASAGSIEALYAAQVLLGVSQGPLYPTSVAFLSPWLPPTERSFASTVLDLGITVASLLALPFSGRIATALGWRGAFRLWGALGLAFAALWAGLAREDPASCSYCALEERAFLAAAAQPPKPKRRRRRSASQPPPPPAWIATARTLLCSGSVWCIFGAHMAFNFCIYFMTSWAPSYYQETFGMRPEDSTLAFSLPPIVDLLVKTLVSTPLEAFLRTARGFSTLQCRRAFTTAGFLGSALSLVALPAASARYGALGATACFSLANGFVALHPAGFKANYMDVTRSSPGVVTGIGNTLASFAAFLGPVFVGSVLQNGSWTPVFVAIAALQLLAALGYGRYASTTPVD